MNILLILLPGIGDGLLFTPALQVLRKQFPKATITGLVMFKGAYEVLDGNPHLDRLIYWNFLKEGLIRSVKYVLSLRKKKFDISIIGYPANRAEYNLISFFIGAKVRIAHQYNHRFFRSLGFLNTRVIQECDDRHNVEEDVELLKLLGIDVQSWGSPKIYLEQTERDFARNWLKDRRLEDKLLIGIHAGTAEFKNQAKRRWGKEKFSELGQRLVNRLNANILIFGGGTEEELKEHIARAIGKRTCLVSGTTMKQTASLIERCTIFVSNDSALMHTSAAMGTPCVTIFGPTNPKWVYPYRVKHVIVRKALPCSPCFYYSVEPLGCKFGDFRCIEEITVNEVWDAVVKLLEKTEG